MTYDIESLFKTQPKDSKYTAEHIPFLICYQVVVCEKGKPEKLVDLPFDNKLEHLPNGNFIISQNPFEKFLDVIYKAQ